MSLICFVLLTDPMIALDDIGDSTNNEMVNLIEPRQTPEDEVMTV